MGVVGGTYSHWWLFFGLLGDKGSDGLPAPSRARLGGWVEGLAGYWR